MLQNSSDTTCTVFELFEGEINKFTSPFIQIRIDGLPLSDKIFCNEEDRRLKYFFQWLFREFTGKTIA